MLMTITACLLVLAAAGIPAAAVEMHGVYEASFTSSRAYENPSLDVGAAVEFVSPSGKRASADAFWDGGGVWRVRFSPTETGDWRWTSECTDPANSGLHGRSGSFECKPYRGSNPLRVHGPLKLSATGRHMAHMDGTPFFWLADTAWNGVLKAKPDDWNKYLSTRRKQGFTAAQFVATHWVALDKDSHGETAFTGKEDIRINPEFYKRLDAKVAAMNEHGLVAAPVMLWAIWRTEPGQALSEKDAIRLCRYLVARWGAYNVVWILGGDGSYLGKYAPRWKNIGRGVFGDAPARPVTMHPGSRQWTGGDFRAEKWFSFIGYQSGHNDSEEAVKWLVEGPPATEWSTRPARPIVNMEPNYEEITSPQTGTHFDALAVRKAMYRSLLVSPTAGATYGHHGVWSWAETWEVPLNHDKFGKARPWYEAVNSEGSQSVKHLAQLFGSIRWWTLRPDREMVQNQPSTALQFIASARSEDGSLAMVYLPESGEVELDASKLKPGARMRWFDPAAGTYTSAGELGAGTLKLTASGKGDRVLVVGE